MESSELRTRRAFGLLFLCVAIAVGAASIISEVAHINRAPLYYHAIIWLGCFGAVFGASAKKLRKAAPAIRGRMKSSVAWPSWSKALNGVSWAGPFVSIAAFPSLYQYLILLGIGLGNLSTYALAKRYSGNDNREQLVVAIVSLAALPVAFAIDSTLFSTHQDIAVMLSRILISAAYAAGGAYAMAGKNGADPVIPAHNQNTRENA